MGAARLAPPPQWYVHCAPPDEPSELTSTIGPLAGKRLAKPELGLEPPVTSGAILPAGTMRSSIARNDPMHGGGIRVAISPASGEIRPKSYLSFLLPPRAWPGNTGRVPCALADLVRFQ